MVTEDIDITLENLLELALGTPEIGAVNFNFLHEVIGEILKHLGISKKIARVTHELDYRLRDIGDVNKVTKVDSATDETVANSDMQAPVTPIGATQHSLESIPPPKKKSSIITAVPRYSQLCHVNEGSLKDAAIVRSMERRDSKTPANDMWHVLNINRRVEAAEAAIQGMTNLIDTINSEMDDLRNCSTTNCNNQSVEPSNNESISKQEQDIMKKMATKLKSYDGKFTDIESKIDNMVVKDEIKGLCGEDKVKEIIKVIAEDDKQQQQAIKETEGALPKQASKETTVEKKKSSIAEVQLTKTSTVVLKKHDSRESRTRVAYQEMSSKMLHLEQEIIKEKEKVAQLDVELNKKVELSRTEGKADQADIISEINESRGEIQALNVHVDSLEESYKVVSGDVSFLVSQNDEFVVQQKTLAKSMRKLEQNLEDMTDNFHRSQSDIVVKNSFQANTVDEAAITKIRGTIFDVQKQQSNFQNLIDSLLQDSKNKHKALEDINAEIQSLEDRKADKTFIKRELECKVDRSAIANKLNRDQLDACIGEIDRNMQAVIQKIEGTEAFAKKSVKDLESSITDKMDRVETKQIHAYIDMRFKSFKPNVQEKRQSAETAAASRKQLLNNCNCLSCDRTVDIPISNDGITLPCYQALPGVKSLRPVNTFDLQTIRQHMQQTCISSNNKYRFEMAHERDKLQKELLQLCGVSNLEELVEVTNRACGGGHTLIEQHRRNPTKPPMVYRDENIPFRQSDRHLLETEVRGRDGHIYRGRMQSPVQLPTISRKGNLSNDKPPTPPPRSPIQNYPSSVDPQQSGNSFTQHKIVDAAE